MASTWSRRDVIRIAGGAAVASATLHSAYPATPFSMPGLYPGRVIGIEHPGSSVKNQYQAAAIQAMIRRGMTELTGADSHAAAWKKLFQPGDVVGIKVNPNGSEQIRSSKACLMAVIGGLLLAGVHQKNIVVYERYQAILDRIQGWLPGWVRTASASPQYAEDQTAIEGYDPEHYVDLPRLLLPGRSADNPRHTRSYAALFATQMVTKIISLAVLKDHPAAGVTLSLKNLSHGCSNNVNRSHPDAQTNHVKEFIPAVISMPVIRNKAVLAIVDGVHGLWAGGAYGGSGCTWEHRTMYFATDLVAADRVGWKAIDAYRAIKGYPPEQSSPPDQYDNFVERQPQHIEAVGKLGLGEWRDSAIDYRRIVIG